MSTFVLFVGVCFTGLHVLAFPEAIEHYNDGGKEGDEDV